MIDTLEAAMVENRRLLSIFRNIQQVLMDIEDDPTAADIEALHVLIDAALEDAP